MATYAAYRHIELYNVGHGKKRVLKPPGGGSSDIFGTSHDPEPQQRKVKNHLTSSIFGGEESQTPARKAEAPQATTNGDKSETAVNGSSSASSTASTPASAAPAPAAAPAASRQRVPPGGFSSGLW